MPTRNVNLTDHFAQFVDELVASGRFQNASEVFRAGLRLLERQTAEEQQQLAALRNLAAEGFEQLDRGQRVSLSGRRRLASHIAQLGRGAASNDMAQPEGE